VGGCFNDLWQDGEAKEKILNWLNKNLDAGATLRVTIMQVFAHLKVIKETALRLLKKWEMGWGLSLSYSARQVV
jgi:hypothetical protein